MNLRVKRTNRPFFDVSPELATILLEMFPDQIERLKMSYQERLALIESERAKQNPNANMEVTFAVERHLETEKWNTVLRCGSEVLYFNGPAIHAAAAFGGGQRSGRTVARSGLRMMPTFPPSPLSVGSRSGAVSLRFSLPGAPRFLWEWTH